MSKLTKQQATQILAETGYFYGLSRIQKSGGVAPDKFLAVKRGVYKFVNVKVQEAKKELVHIQTALNQMEMDCRRGAGSSSHGDPLAEAAALMRACMNLQGWAVSLFESVVTLEEGVLTPETAANTVKQLQSAFHQLWDKRVSEGYRMLNNHPEFFDVGSIHFEGGESVKW